MASDLVKLTATATVLSGKVVTLRSVHFTGDGTNLATATIAKKGAAVLLALAVNSSSTSDTWNASSNGVIMSSGIDVVIAGTGGTLTLEIEQGS